MSEPTIPLPPTGPLPGDDREVEAAAFKVNALLVAVMGAVLGLPYLAFALSSATIQALAPVMTGELMVASLLWRRSNPRQMLIWVTAAGILHMLLVPWPTLFLVTIPLAVYSYARWVEGHPRLVLVIGVAASVLGPLSWFPSITNGTTDYSGEATLYVLFVMVCAGLVVTPYAFGRRVRDAALVKEQREASRAQRYAESLRSREHATRMAEMNTRAQIARELHDIVAHSVSVMIVQAEGGKALATKKPEAAAEVLGTIAETGREALTEMRRLVGVLRGGPEDQTEYAPAPTLDDLATMVERAGERVRLVVHGEDLPNAPVLQLTIFRIAQEGVTNFLKHAGPDAHCQVTLDLQPDWTTLTVEDDGAGAAASSDGAGHGLKGMAERVAAVGGTLVARPKDPEGRTPGFLVRATFPLRQYETRRTPRSTP